MAPAQPSDSDLLLVTRAFGAAGGEHAFACDLGGIDLETGFVHWMERVEILDAFLKWPAVKKRV